MSRIRLRVLSLTALVLCGTTVAQTRAPFELERLTLPSAVNIEPLRTTELLQGGRGTVSFNGSTLPSHSIDTRVTRTLTGLWTMNIDPSRMQSAALQVDYELRGLNGKRDSLSMPGRESDTIPVRIEPMAPRMIRTLGGLATVEGGVVLHLDVERVRFAGDYQGTLVISVNRL